MQKADTLQSYESMFVTTKNVKHYDELLKMLMELQDEMLYIRKAHTEALGADGADEAD